MSDPPALNSDLAVGDALRAVARGIISDARAAIEDRNRSDARTVHDFRREMKRWRGLLRLLQPFLGEAGRQLRTQARDLARALGGARDAQSALDALDDLAKGGDALSGRSMATIRKRIEEFRQAAETVAVTAEIRLRLAGALDRAETAIAHWQLDSLSYDDVARRLTREYCAAASAAPDRWDDAGAEQLHELRKAIVAHRYQMELVVPLWPRFGKMWIGEAQRLRNQLGAYQDLTVLDRLTDPHQLLARWRSRLRPAIEQRKAEHARAAKRIAKRLLADKPKAFHRRLAAMWETG